MNFAELFLAFGRIVIGFLAVVGFVEVMGWLSGVDNDSRPTIELSVTRTEIHE